MRGVKRETPLYALCQRPGCEGYRAVRCPAYQRQAKYCSHRCAAFMTKNARNQVEAGRKGGRTSGQRRQRAVLERVNGLTPLQAFRLGYVRGLMSKHRQVRKKAKAA